MESTSAAPEEPIRVGDHVDRYVVEGRIGEGDTAVVYLVRHREHGTLHALKLIRVVSSRAIRRIEQEGRVQALLRHRNVVPVVGVIRVGVLPGLVMAYVEGPTLEQLLRSVRPTPPQVDALARDLMEGVRAAHRHRLVHRDLKPANVLVAFEDGRAVAKITDFGVAKVVAEHAGLTRTGAVIGTPAYMAPEQFRSARDVDERADIFALGALLYELASGERALRGDDVISVHLAAARGDFRPLSEVAPGVPARWVEATRRALQPRAEDRPATVAELYALWTGGEPLGVVRWDPEMLGRAVHSGSSASRTGRASRGWIPVGVLGLALLVGLGAVALVLLLT